MRAWLVSVVFGWAALGCPAAALTQDLPTWASERSAPGRRALSIAMSDYLYASDLVTPAVDSGMLDEAFDRFDVPLTRERNLDREALLNTLAAFAASIQQGDLAILHYSGHGLEVAGINYLVPIDKARPEPEREGLELVSLDYVIETLTKRRPGLLLIILDACRTDPFNAVASDVIETTVEENIPEVLTSSLSPADPGGLAPLVNAPTGLIVAYAAAPRTTSYSLLSNEVPAAGSIFTRALVKALLPHRRLSWTLDETAYEVGRLSGGRQQPWTAIRTGGQVMLEPSAAFRAEEDEAWRLAVQAYVAKSHAEELRRFLHHYPVSAYGGAALAEIAQDEGIVATTYAASSVNNTTSALTGSVTTSSSAEGLPTFFARSTLQLRSLVEGASLGRIDAGAGLRIMSVTNEGLARVLTSDGRLGVIEGVTPAKVLAEFTSGFGPAAAGEDSVLLDPNILTQVADAAQAQHGTVVIRTGEASDDDPGRAAQLAYLRALRLQARLAELGVPFERIEIMPAMASAQPDSVLLQALSTPET